jgi:hypothetical protein
MICVFAGVYNLAYNKGDSYEDELGALEDPSERPNLTFKGTPFESPDTLLKEYASLYGVPEELAFSVAYHENYNDWESNSIRSSKGCLGIMQVCPQYHVGPGRTCEGIADSPSDLVGPTNRRNNIHCGVKFLSLCLKKAFRASSTKTTKDKLIEALMGYNNSRSYALEVLSGALEYRENPKG